MSHTSPDRASLPIGWTDHPARRAGRATGGALLLIGVALTAVARWGPGPYALPLAAVLLAWSLAPYFLPTHYRADDAGLVERCGWSRRTLLWDDVVEGREEGRGVALLRRGMGRAWFVRDGGSGSPFRDALRSRGLL